MNPDPANEIHGSKHGCTKSWTFARTSSCDKGMATPSQILDPGIFERTAKDCAKPSILEEDYRIHATEPLVKCSPLLFRA